MFAPLYGYEPKPQQNGPLSTPSASPKDCSDISALFKAKPTIRTRRRAAKACLSCNARKVRCDVTGCDTPCTNCRLDDVECVIPVRKRRRGTDSNNDTGPSAARVYDKDDTHIQSRTNFGSVGGPADLSLAHPLPEHNAVHQDSRLATQPTVEPRRLSPPLLHEDRTQPMGAHASYGLPRYISPLPPHLGIDEIALLRKKNALNLPSAPLQDALLQSFIEYTYPSMPVLDLHDFLTAIKRRDGKQTISLLLLHAVLFAGVATVDKRHLQHAGYRTRQAARREIFQKVRLLYNFDCERDEIVLVQSLLLMSCCSEAVDDGKDGSHWISIANSLCHNIGLQAAIAKRSQKEQALWKRLRWVAYMRDILVALDIQRAPQFSSKDLDLPMLIAEDFEIVIWRRGEQHLAETCQAKATPTMQREAAIICAEQAKLCLCLGRILSLHYNASQDQEHSELARRLSAFIGDANFAGGLQGVVVQECSHALRGWEDQLAPEARWTQPSWQDINDGRSSIIVQRLNLRILFLTAVLTLHRPLPPPSPSVEPIDQLPLWTTDDNSTEVVRQAVSEITEIATMALGFGLVPKLPTTFVSALRAAVAVHFTYLTDGAMGDLSLHGLQAAFDVVESMSDNSSDAEGLLALIRDFAAMNNIQLNRSRTSSEHSASPSSDGQNHLCASMAQLQSDVVGSRPAVGTPVEKKARVSVPGDDVLDALLPPWPYLETHSRNVAKFTSGAMMGGFDFINVDDFT